jgi:hypothetical protein
MKVTAADIGNAMRGLVARCPACGRDIGQHRWAILGSAEINTPEERALRLAFQEGDWSTIMNLHSGSGRTNFFAVNALSCPETGRLSVLEILSSFELWMDDELLQTTVLSLEQSKSVAIDIAAGAWRVIT